MKKLLFICGLVLLIECVTEPVPVEPKIIFYAKSSIVEYLPLYIYLDSSFVGTLVDTVNPFKTEFPPMSDKALLKIDVTPGKHSITVLSLPGVQENNTKYTSLENIQNDIVLQPNFHSTREIDVEMGQYRFLGVGH